MSAVKQRIPSTAWFTARENLSPIGDPLRGGLISTIWRAIIGGRWDDYDKARKLLDEHLKILDAIRKDEPVMEADDPGWQEFMQRRSRE